MPNTIFILSKQTPNQQIWFSSPISGPARFDYMEELNIWKNKHNDDLAKLL